MKISELYQVFLKHPVVTTDTRDCPKNSMFFALRGASFNGNDFAIKALESGCAYAVVDDERVVGDERLIHVPDVLTAMQELAAYHRQQLHTPILQVTGTNGKTTTTSLTDYLLKAAGEASVAVGNIGEPPVNEIDGRAHNEWFVAELSSYQIATTAELHPRVAVLLNITPDHLGWHKSHKNYALAKIKLFENMVDDDLVVIDVEDAGIHEFDEYIYTPGRRICKVAFDEPEGADAAFVRDGKMIVRLKGVETQLVATSELKISGHHNVINALCAATAALAVGADPEGICRGLASFQPLEHRVEPCGEIDGVRYVNDSKATNTDAVEKALTAFPDDDVILLLGGHDKGTPLADFARVVMDNVRSVVCFGDARERFTAAMDEADVDGDVDIAQADDLRDAVDVARSLSSRGDVILLSPACSSFDEFSGYEERGRVFKDCVAQLAAAAKSQTE